MKGEKGVYLTGLLFGLAGALLMNAGRASCGGDARGADSAVKALVDVAVASGHWCVGLRKEIWKAEDLESDFGCFPSDQFETQICAYADGFCACCPTDVWRVER